MASLLRRYVAYCPRHYDGTTGAAVTINCVADHVAGDPGVHGHAAAAAAAAVAPPHAPARSRCTSSPRTEAASRTGADHATRTTRSPAARSQPSTSAATIR